MSLKVIHFQSIFLIYFYLKRLIYVQKYGITNQTVMQQVIQEKEEFLHKKGQQVDEHQTKASVTKTETTKVATRTRCRDSINQLGQLT